MLMLCPHLLGDNTLCTMCCGSRGEEVREKKFKYMDRETLCATFLEKHSSRDKTFIKLQISSKCQSNLKCEDTNKRKGGKDY